MDADLKSISPWTLSRFKNGQGVTVRSALAATHTMDTTIDEALDVPPRYRAPPKLRKRPLRFVLRRLNLSMKDLAQKAEISMSAAAHAANGQDVNIDTVKAIAAALNWPVQDVAEMIVTPIETMTIDELRSALEKAPLHMTKTQKAKALGMAIQTLNRLLTGKLPIPPGLREDLRDLGWIDKAT